MKIEHVLKEYEYNPEEDSKATETYRRLRRDVGEMYADAFWRMWRKTSNVNAALNMAQEEYDNMVRYESVEEESVEKEEVNEAMSDAYGMPSNDNLEGSVSYSQHKNNDKGAVTIEASADSMADLQDILKLAGVDVAVDLNKSDDAHDHEEPVEIEVTPPKEEILMPQKGDEGECDETCPDDCPDCGHEESPCGSSDDNVSYETDKEILVNYIKDQLKKRLS